jgi:hypothetical protein
MLEILLLVNNRYNKEYKRQYQFKVLKQYVDINNRTISNRGTFDNQKIVHVFTILHHLGLVLSYT